MRNIMRSDIYRILHGKCIYITFIVFIMGTIMQAAFPGSGTIGVSVENIPGVATTIEELSGKVTGMEAPFVFMDYADNIIFYMLSIIFALAATDFSSGAIKNTLTNGVSRTKVYLSKLILASVISLLMFISGILIYILVLTFMNGFGGSLTGPYMLSVLRPFAAQFLLLVAAISIGMAIIFISKKGATLNAVYIGFFLGLTLVLLIISETFPGIQDIIKYDFMVNFKKMASIDSLPTVDIIRALAIGILCIITSTPLGILIFRKSEIK